ncbi:MerR family transcriptional regulator [Anoxynatronum buryatiense]|uniref:DNA-binding transcriptional regulator, MerR family n=1 Tax=Anoxynatronum buryatiense TaxID=489973 RepID=A0AA45WVE5_9CLOT|nr:MerR family transcriptional regulator [Anoxynatronum buryatiense]SMP53412.1 DNA-binding transcriptional regulator, MerR family [Anoxynatronum buryatiense]
MKKYRVSEFSKWMGVSIKTLKHYEKFKILAPEKDEETNYRYYNFTHGERILRSKELTSLGISLNEVYQYMNNKGMDEIVSVLTRCEEELSREMDAIRLKQKRIHELKEQCTLFVEKPNTWMIATRKPCYFIKHVQDKAFVESEKAKKIVTDLMKCVPHTMKLAYLPQKEIERNALDPILGLGVNGDTAEHLKPDVSEPILSSRRRI